MLNYNNDTQLMTLEDIILQHLAADAGNLQEHFATYCFYENYLQRLLCYLLKCI